MKFILTITFVLFIGLFANAQENTAKSKQMDATESVVYVNKEVIKSTEIKIVRLYKTKNHNVLKALSFETRYNKTKLA
jgi:hypothetical protein